MTFFRYIALIILLGNAFSISANNNIEYGAKVGLSFQFGTHIQRVGLMYEVYYYTPNIQLTQGLSLHYNWKNLGPKKSGFEAQVHAGIQYVWGDSSDRKHYLLSEYSLMNPRKYSFGYMYTHFLDQVETSQAVGSLFFNINRFGFVFENDLFGGRKGYQDKYRTGALALTYVIDSFQIALQTTHWTGMGYEGAKIKSHDYPGKNGYKDLSKAKYGHISHGILALRLDYQWKYMQTFRSEAGIDAEQVRHILQNKFVHDFLVPSGITKYENPHYPMLQADGTPYLFKEGQKIRPAKPYFQTGTNQFMFY